MPSPIHPVALWLTAALVCDAAAARAQNLVTNGGFTTGTLAGYTSTGQFYVVGPGVNGTGYAAETGALTSTPAVLTQAIATTPGWQYAISFYALNAQPGSTQNFLRVRFGGTTLFDQPIVSGTFEQFSLRTAPAAGTATDLTFEVGNDPSATFLDDISVAALSGSATTAPEPVTLALVAGGVAALAAVARSRRAPLFRA